MVAAYVKGARTPFLESPLIDCSEENKTKINLAAIKTAKETFADGIVETKNNGGNKPCLVVGYRDDLIEKPDNTDGTLKVETMKDAFNTINGWLKMHFVINDQNTNPSDQSETK
jgi:hypothetical protein